MSTEILLRAEALTKDFGAKRAVDGISLEVRKGEVLGFMGPNGAGKTTTMKLLTGYLSPTSGSAEICGMAVTPGDPRPKKRIGYLPEGAPLYGDMTVLEFLNFVAQAHSLSSKRRIEAISGASEALELEGVAHQTIDTLSKGFKRRVGLAAAILHDPDVLLLDEPTDGLDPNQKYQVRRLIEAMSADRAIIISTHILEEVEALCTRAVMIAGGRIVADGTPDQLKARSIYAGAVNLTVDHAIAAKVSQKLESLTNITQIEMTDDGIHARFTVIPQSGADITSEVGDLVANNGWQLHAFGVETGRLDDVFRTLTAGDLT